MINYTATIFAESGTDLTPTMAAIAMGFIQLMGTYFSTLLVDRTGRKVTFFRIFLCFTLSKRQCQFLLTFSAFGTGLSLLVLGLYTYLKSLGVNVDGLGWIPVVSFGLVLFIASCGVLPLPFVVISEIIPEKVIQNSNFACWEPVSKFTKEDLK